MKTLWPYMLMALSAGALTPIQALINGRLAGLVGGVLSASVISFAVGLTALATIVFGLRLNPFHAENLHHAPAWMFLGGLMGAYFISTTALTAPKLGTAAMIALLIAGQLIFSVLIDHFGFMLPAAQPVTAIRLAGVALLVSGVFLIINFR